MRAVLVKDGKGPSENLYIGETPTPVPGATEVLVKVQFLCLVLHLVWRIEVPLYPPCWFCVSRSKHSVWTEWTLISVKELILLPQDHPRSWEWNSQGSSANLGQMWQIGKLVMRYSALQAVWVFLANMSFEENNTCRTKIRHIWYQGSLRGIHCCTTNTYHS